MGRTRRTLSISGPIPNRTNEERLTYNLDHGEFCVVVGWKSGLRWTFKAIKMKRSSPMRSRWYTVAQADVNAGVANIL